MSDGDAIWIYFGCFLCCLPPSLFAAKSTDAKSAYIESVESFCTKGIYTSNTCARCTCAGNTFSTVGACIKGTGPDGTGTRDAGRESACAGSACAIKHSRIYLQSFSILEMELFHTGWSSSIDVLSLKYSSLNILLKLGTGVEAGWWSLRLLQILYRPTSITVNGFLNNVVIGTAGVWNPLSWNCYISSGFLPYRCCNQKAISLDTLL